MGVTIHYAMRTDLTYRREIRRMVDGVRKCALDLPFLRVGEIKEFAEGDPPPTNPEDEWLRLQADAHIEVEGRYYIVPAKHTVAFTIWPGYGCEVANFGFSRFPGYLHPRGQRRISTGIKGWNWSSYCETQYASNPQFGGVRNFLRCHLSLVRVLDFLQKLRLCHVEVRDDSGYWKQRNVAALAQNIGDWNSFVDGITNELRNTADGSGFDIETAIIRFPNYQRLEARCVNGSPTSPRGSEKNL